MKYTAETFKAADQESMIQQEAIINSDAVYTRYELEKKLIRHVAAGNYEQAVQVLDSFSMDPDDYKDAVTRISREPDKRLRYAGQLVNSTLRVSLLSSQIPVIYLHIVSTHFGILLEDAPIEYLREEKIIHRIIEAYCYYAKEYSGIQYSDTVSRITDYIIFHIKEELSLRQIADAFHFSDAYVNRVLKKETGYTVVQYIKKNRIVLAKTLLHFDDLSIAEVASLVGYPDCNYFCRVFKQVEGVSPVQFRVTEGRVGIRI